MGWDAIPLRVSPETAFNEGLGNCKIKHRVIVNHQDEMIRQLSDIYEMTVEQAEEVFGWRKMANAWLFRVVSI